MKHLGDGDGVVVLQDVAHFVAQHSGEFVVVAKYAHHCSCDVDAFSACTERICLRSVDEDDANLCVIYRKLRQHATADSLQMPSEPIILVDLLVLLHPFCFDVTKFELLLRTENITALRRVCGRHHAELLCSYRAAKGHSEGDQRGRREDVPPIVARTESKEAEESHALSPSVVG